MLYCPGCGLLQLADPDWLHEAYDSAIAVADTGLVARNLHFSQMLTPLLFHLFGEGTRCLDMAGGTGLLVRLMRDAGFDFYWHDPYCANVHARGFEGATGGVDYGVVTAFEVIEHLPDPVGFFRQIIDDTGAEAVFFSTQLYEGAPPPAQEWWYYAFDTGQHISFFQQNTLDRIAKILGMRYCSVEQIQVFCQERHEAPVRAFADSSLARRIARFKAKKSLRSKTMPDHLQFMGRGR